MKAVRGESYSEDSVSVASFYDDNFSLSTLPSTVQLQTLMHSLFKSKGSIMLLHIVTHHKSFTTAELLAYSNIVTLPHGKSSN